MSDAFIGEIRTFAGPGIGGEPPQGWMFCYGQELNISQYEPLFALIGTTFGGNGVSTFNLPDLRGRTPIGQGSAPSLTPRVLGQTGGTTTTALTTGQMPAHTHNVMAGTGTATTDTPGQTVLIANSGTNTTLYTKVDSSDPKQVACVFDPNAVSNSSGTSQSHGNVMPSLGVNYIICFNGLFPERP